MHDPQYLRTLILTVLASGVAIGCLHQRVPPEARVDRAECATGQQAAEVLEYGRSFADPEEREAWRLGSLDTADVTLVSDPASCQRAAEVFNALLSSSARQRVYGEVGVVRLGRSGYLISTPSGGQAAGEFWCNRVLVDARWRGGKLLCG